MRIWTSTQLIFHYPKTVLVVVLVVIAGFVVKAWWDTKDLK
jgi:hypothetical protein